MRAAGGALAHAGLERTLVEPEGPIDLLPMRDRVLAVIRRWPTRCSMPASSNLKARCAAASRVPASLLAGGYASHGEPARGHDARRPAITLWLGGTRLQPEAAVAHAAPPLPNLP